MNEEEIAMKNVTEVMADRLAAAGLEVPDDAHPVHAALATIAANLDVVIPTVADASLSLRLLAEALRSYADVAEECAAAQEAAAT